MGEAQGPQKRNRILRLRSGAPRGAAAGPRHPEGAPLPDHPHPTRLSGRADSPTLLQTC